MKYFSGFIVIFLSLSSFAQLDTISVMYYNLLNFPGSSAEQTRVDTLEDIIAYVKPDLFLVNELESLYGANLILSNAMNVNGVTHYQRATYYSGPDTQNMLYYNEDKFGLIQQFQITTDLRDVSEYHLYYKEPNMNASTDTVYLWAYSCHLKAGSYQDDEDRRELEATQFKNYLDNLNRSGNLILGGDFNIYSSAEDACQTILYEGNVAFYDPINQLGNWNNNSFYEAIHTQSTRSSSGGFAGGASGGLDDRFDIIFATEDIMQGNQRLKYLAGSYESIGNDANHFNSNINSGTNTAVPQDIANALYHNSDHLPVYMEMVIDAPVGVTEFTNVVSSAYYSNLDNSLHFIFKEGVQQIDLEVYNLSGKQIYQIEKGQEIIRLPYLNSGIYLAKVSTDKGVNSIKFVVE